MKNLKLVITGCCFFMANLCLANVGNQFPDLTGETLKDEKVNIPKATKGKFTIIGVASSKKADKDLRTWMQPVYDQFINQNTFIPIDYNVNIYFVPMFNGANKVAYNSMKKKTKKELDKELHPYVLFYKGNISLYQEELKLKEKSKPYFFVLDENGKIVYSTSGKFTQKKLDKIEGFVLE